MKEVSDSLRPLSGAFVFKSVMDFGYIGKDTVSVPCRGLLFLNDIAYYLYTIGQSLRPLSGAFVFKLQRLICRSPEP